MVISDVQLALSLAILASVVTLGVCGIVESWILHGQIQRLHTGLSGLRRDVIANEKAIGVERSRNDAIDSRGDRMDSRMNGMDRDRIKSR